MANGGGILWTQAAAAALETISVVQILKTPQLQAPTSNGPYRPSQWSKPAQVSITVPASYQQTSSASNITSAGSGTVPDSGGTFTMTQSYKTVTTPPKVYIFDAILRTEHSRELRKTEHPVQTGASISDHAFILPARVVLEIGMYDTMDSFQAGAWKGNTSKSVAAYQTLISLWRARVPLMVTTRLDTYQNMLIESVHAPDDVKTKYSLRAVVTFGETFMATVAAQTISARPQATDTTSIGTKQAIPVPVGIAAQHQVTSSTPVPAAGNWNSNNNTGGL